SRVDFAGQVRMAGVAPLLAWCDRHDFAVCYVPEATRAKRDGAVAPQQPAARRTLLDGERDELDRPAQIEVFGRGLVLAFASRGPGGLGGIGIEAQALTVGG